MGRGFFQVENCSVEVGGGFRPPDGVSGTPAGRGGGLVDAMRPETAAPCGGPCLPARSKELPRRLLPPGTALFAYRPIYFNLSMPLLHPTPTHTFTLFPATPPTHICLTLPQIVICHNHLGSQLEVDQALTHELVHAYDHCRARNMDWTNCRQHACSEIRAASLSGRLAWGGAGAKAGSSFGGGGGGWRGVLHGGGSLRRVVWAAKDCRQVGGAWASG